MRRLILAAAALATVLAGCSREQRTEQAPNVRRSTVVEPETRGLDVVPQEEPAVARSQWRAASDTARRVSGNLRVSLLDRRGGPVVFAFANGITIQAQPYQEVPADSRSGVGGQSFAAVLGGDPRVSTYLYRVQSETVTNSASQGGLCGQERTRYMAVSEFVDGSGRWVFKIAAFRDDEAPPSGRDPGLCNAYAYTAQ
jgi:outer membrane murein-binding lipoprotein Lpp